MAYGPQRQPVAAHHLLNFIDGRWTPAASGSTRTNRNPADLRDTVGEFTESDGADADRAVVAAATALPAWRALGPIRRAAHLTALPATPAPRLRPISLVRRPDRLLSPAERAFLDVLRGVRHWPGKPDDAPEAASPTA